MSASSDDVQLPKEYSILAELLEEHPESFVYGSKDVQAAALNAAKYIFDLAIKSEQVSKPHVVSLISSLSPAEAPQTRSGKRKRSPSPVIPVNIFNETPIPSLFVEGMDQDQIWEQLDLRAKHICATLENALEAGGAESDEEEKDLSMDGDEAGMGMFEGEDSVEEESEDEDNAEEESDDDVDLGEDTVELRDPSDEEDEEEEHSMSSILRVKRPPKRKSGGHPELDDGFFDLASFNAETEQVEARKSSRGKLSQGSDDSDSDEDNESVDLFAPVDDDAPEDGDDEEAFYKDFFEPPPRNSAKGKGKASPSKKGGRVRFHDEVRVKNIKAKGKNMPLSAMYEDDDDEDEEGEEEGGFSFGDLDDDDDQFGEPMGLEDDEEDEEDEEGDGDSSSEDEAQSDEKLDGEHRETIERLKDDLFAEEETAETDLSTHEKRMAALREQISTLESENVGKKDWVLMGEASSRARPQNSLLEEDLEFERVMKAVPVITEENVQTLEEKIKARILEGRFDDVVHLRPVEDKPFLPSRMFELQDKKSSQSLAQIYEDEYTAAQTGGVVGDDRDGKLKKEHDEIEKQWENICGKLDALCNVHFTPKAPKAIISTVSNIAVATLESALPTSKSASTMLAPEEVFAPSPSDLRARSELTPAEKRALRSKERKAKKKARDVLDKSVDKYARKTKGIKKQKQEALESVVKNGKGITVVGKNKKDILSKRTRR